MVGWPFCGARGYHKESRHDIRCHQFWFAVLGTDASPDGIQHTSIYVVFVFAQGGPHFHDIFLKSSLCLTLVHLMSYDM